MPPKKRQINADCESIKLDSKKRKLPQSIQSSTDEYPKFLHNVEVYILKAGIEKARLQIFQTQLKKYGGTVCENITLSTTLTHIVVDDKMDCDRMCKIMNFDGDVLPKACVVKSAWLSACFRQKKFVSTDEFELDIVKFLTHMSAKNLQASPNTCLMDDEISAEKQNAVNLKSESKQSDSEDKPQFPKAGVMWGALRAPLKTEDNNSDSDYVPSDEESNNAQTALGEISGPSPGTSSTDTTPNTSPQKQLPVGKWICAQSSKNPKPNFNKLVTEKLEEMVKNYESTNDKWRAFGYQKAIQALRRCPKEVSSWEEAKALPDVGARLADKIWEIIQSGELRKLNEFKSNDEIKILNMFTDLWGAGPHTARVWYQQGFRSLEDLRTKANLTHQQKIGLRLYDDLLDRMPRSEAAEIEMTVRKAAESLQEGIIAQACGSYRRGKPTCGDVDILVTHPDGKSHQGIYGRLIAKLKENGFLTDDLVSAEDTGNQKKYLGVCKLPGENRKHRRLDIIVVPYDEYGCALVYFTGSAHFNRSLRHLAKKMSMSLNEHALKTGVVRKGGEKIYEGTKINTPTEESVFRALGVPVRPPEERDH